MKTVLITGGNSGIGKCTAAALARQGYRVFIAARDQAKSEAAIADIRSGTPQADVTALKLDLSDLAQVRQFADDFLTRITALDVLILNAGLFPIRREITAQDFEMQFGVNHLGHFLLNALLLDRVHAAPAGRIVVVSSIMHWLGRIDFDSFRGEKKYNPVVAYGQSKLANVLFTQELARREGDSGLRVNALHPGGVDTGIARDAPKLVQKIYSMATVSPEKGAESSVYLASDEAARRHHGKFIRNCKPMRVSPMATQETAEKLWRVSENLVADYL